MNEKERIKLIDQYINMALDTGDKKWFMELTNEKISLEDEINEILKEIRNQLIRMEFDEKDVPSLLESSILLSNIGINKEIN
ncbi:IDEAL domain-containing protein [Priestia megaterium]|uniref:IDEAL domain-containing protein n=1 Tax=Priestia megaterium TaxID=1404 RepID=UPI00112E87B3|nr:IDEAL domain-containing protein [Priestia megaterium]TPF18055.1 hypothetical protein CBE78_02170 [Priestia megaterium]TPF22162.1 hypothetical protein CBE79_04675 [Priestia megaterium]